MVKFARLIALSLSALSVFYFPGLAYSESELKAETVYTFGGKGNQAGVSIQGADLGLWIAGSELTALRALAVRYPVPISEGFPPGSLIWGTTNLDTNFYDISASPEGLYFAGSILTPAKKKTDQNKVRLLAKFALTGAAPKDPVWVVQTAGDPSKSYEAFYAVATQEEDGVTAIYAAGYTEIGTNNTTALLAKYDAKGSLLWSKNIGAEGTMEKSAATAVEVMDGEVYVAGYVSKAGKKPKFNTLPLFAAVWKYDREGQLLWTKTIAPELNPAEALSFLAHKVKVDVTAFKGFIYLASSKKNNADSSGDILLTKLNAKGESVWESAWKASLPEEETHLTPHGAWAFGITEARDRLFIAGAIDYTDALAFTRDQNALVLEVDKDYGNVLAVHRYGDLGHVENAFSVTSVGDVVYAAGTQKDIINTTKTATKTDVLLLKYPIGPVTEVKIELVPSSSSAEFDLNGVDKVSIAVISEAGFNAPIEIDTYSLTFGRTGNEASWSQCEVRDVNKDGTADLVCGFNRSWTPWKQSFPIFKEGDSEGVLKGLTHSGRRLLGKTNLRKNSPAIVEPSPAPEPPLAPEPKEKPLAESNTIPEVKEVFVTQAKSPAGTVVISSAPVSVGVATTTSSVGTTTTHVSTPSVKPLIAFTPEPPAVLPAKGTSLAKGPAPSSESRNAVLERLVQSRSLYSGERKSESTTLPAREESSQEESASATSSADLVAAYEDMAKSALKNGMIEKAVSYYREGIHLDPTAGHLHTALGLIYIQEKKWDAAVEELTQALKLDPKDTTARENLEAIQANLES